MTIPDEILTERLRLRPQQLSDAEQIFVRYASDLTVSRYLSWPTHQTVDDTLEFVRKRMADCDAGTAFSRLIFARDSGILLGAVGGRIEGHCMAFGYCLARDSWGRGYATEAASALVDVIQTNPSISRIQAFCDVENLASARVLEKIGLAFEGTLRRYMVLPNLGEEPRDVHCYAIVRNDGIWTSS